MCSREYLKFKTYLLTSVSDPVLEELMTLKIWMLKVAPKNCDVYSLAVETLNSMFTVEVVLLVGNMKSEFKVYSGIVTETRFVCEVSVAVHVVFVFLMVCSDFDCAFVEVDNITEHL
ncbi:hypothetical protein DPMN_095179 [Dreissena polymorpha]|uniref:Uncharacterized protein n=1 Tax=Dreissena polymorpha TaxID=45954 RepID=A0A9D4L6W5_DREPO|nr:hypothetical protein DPMN_095126 [Dreissena polymorpha]KAH3852666.1 hypothetical protein DPMN_095179 [Dreissena polymorpha]